MTKVRQHPLAPPPHHHHHHSPPPPPPPHHHHPPPHHHHHLRGLTSVTIEVARQVTVSTPQGGNDSNDVRLEPGQQVFLSTLNLVNRNCIVVFF